MIQQYVSTLDMTYDETKQSYKTINKLKRLIKEELDYRDLLVIQSSPLIWSKLMHDPDFHLRRILCKKINNLTEAHFMDSLDCSSGAANALFNKTGIPKLPRFYQLGVLFGHPWQIVNKKDPMKEVLCFLRALLSWGC